MKESVGWFGTGRSFVKAILCLYVMHKPKSFDTDQDVIIDNSYLKVSTSKNYHHFFPRAYMKKYQSDFGYWTVNHILNITIVDANLNKNKIKAKAPSVYMKKFIKENENIEKTMRTHMITSLNRFGIFDDEYDKFLKERAKLVSRELTKRIIDQTTGFEEQVEEIEEVIEVVTEED